MYIHKEGYKIILTIIILIIVLNFIAYLITKGNIYAVVFSILVSAIFLSLIIWFFRDPQRKVMINDKNILSPADGKVVVIEKIYENQFFNEERIQVSIFMSPLNVHVNYYPMSGIITDKEYFKGDYLVAWHPKSSEKNERSVVLIKNEDGTNILVKQIAGAVARRIVTYAKKDQEVIQGDELGFIKFGSRVDILLPLEAQINVNINDMVKGKETVIATLPEEKL